MNRPDRATSSRYSGARGKVFVVSGPSGVGKGTLCRLLLERVENLRLSVSATSRPKRPEEQEGRDYFFVDRPTFERMIADRQMLEWAEYNDNLYGTPRGSVERLLAEGRHVLLEIETRGALMVKDLFPEACLVFLMPPSIESLEKRLAERGTNGPEDIQSRLRIAKAEIAVRNRFDYVLVNDTLPDCCEKLVRIVSREVSA